MKDNQDSYKDNSFEITVRAKKRPAAKVGSSIKMFNDYMNQVKASSDQIKEQQSASLMLVKQPSSARSRRTRVQRMKGEDKVNSNLYQDSIDADD